MVSQRCKLLARHKLKELGIEVITVNLGEVEIEGDISAEFRLNLATTLKESGLELMGDKKSELIRRIKEVVIEMVNNMDEVPVVKFSDYLAEKVGEKYKYMSILFSEREAISIAQFILLHKIERVKELIIFDKLNLTEIAWKLNYSSVSHLSQQFKNITGLTPTFFKSLKIKKDKNIK